MILVPFIPLTKMALNFPSLSFFIIQQCSMLLLWVIIDVTWNAFEFSSEITRYKHRRIKS